MVSISNIIIFRKEVVCRTDIAFLVGMLILCIFIQCNQRQGGCRTLCWGKFIVIPRISSCLEKAEYRTGVNIGVLYVTGCSSLTVCFPEIVVQHDLLNFNTLVLTLTLSRSCILKFTDFNSGYTRFKHYLRFVKRVSCLVLTGHRSQLDFFIKV